MDALEWTRHWLQNRRCDLLTFHIATNTESRPAIRITAVESKGRTDHEPLPLDELREPFADACEQVAATLKALHLVICPEGTGSPMDDARLTALFEHVMSELLAAVSPIMQDDDETKAMVDNLDAMSKRRLQCGRDLTLGGLVAVTQRAVTVSTESKWIRYSYEGQNWPIKLVRAGLPALEGLLGSGIPEEAQFDVEMQEGRDSARQSDGNSSSSRGEDFDVTSVEYEKLETIGITKADSSGDEENALPDTEDMKHAFDMVADDSIKEHVDTLISKLTAACRLRGFGIGDIDPNLVTAGPTLVCIPAVLKAGESVRPIQAAHRDLARELGVPSLTVENDTRAYHIRFLVPRTDRQFPELPDSMLRPISGDQKNYLGVALGVDLSGEAYWSYVSTWPHLLVAGTTGSGKTTFIKSIIKQLDESAGSAVELIVVDGKAEYDYIDLVRAETLHGDYPEVLLGHERAPEVLEWLVDDEIVRRRTAITEYFRSHPEAPRVPKQAYANMYDAVEQFPIKPLVIVIDEFAELMLSAGQEARRFESLVQRVVQAGRSAMVHLVLATQRPDANVVRGAIKANLPSRVALALPSHHDSMTILNSTGAEELLGSGDLIYLSNAGEFLRLQGYW